MSIVHPGVLPPLTLECDCLTGFRFFGDGDPCSRWAADARACCYCAGTMRVPNVVLGGACRSCATYPENPPQRAEPGDDLCRECRSNQPDEVTP